MTPASGHEPRRRHEKGKYATACGLRSGSLRSRIRTAFAALTVSFFLGGPCYSASTRARGPIASMRLPSESHPGLHALSAIYGKHAPPKNRTSQSNFMHAARQNLTKPYRTSDKPADTQGPDSPHRTSRSRPKSSLPYLDPYQLRTGSPNRSPADSQDAPPSPNLHPPPPNLKQNNKTTPNAPKATDLRRAH